MTKEQVSCDGANFLVKHKQLDAGLRKIDPAVAATYEANYQALVNTLTSNDPRANGTLTADMLTRALTVRGYYLGKEQLSCLLDHDFAHFRGIQIQLGLTEHPLTGNAIGNLVYTIRGQFATNGKKPAPITLPNGSTIDGGFGQLSEVVFLAGTEPVAQVPDPSTYPNPPYVPPVVTSNAG